MPINTLYLEFSHCVRFNHQSKSDATLQGIYNIALHFKDKYSLLYRKPRPHPVIIGFMTMLCHYLCKMVRWGISCSVTGLLHIEIMTPNIEEYVFKARNVNVVYLTDVVHTIFIKGYA